MSRYQSPLTLLVEVASQLAVGWCRACFMLLFRLQMLPLGQLVRQ